MIVKDLKLACQLMKNGHEVKKFLGMTAILMIFGAVMACFQDLTLGMCGAFIMMSAPMMLFQSFMGVNMLRVVQSSPKAKYLQTSVMSTVLVGLELVGYLLSTLVMMILVATGVLPVQGIGMVCLLMCGFAVFTMIYYIFSYRFFAASTVFFYVGFFAGFASIQKGMEALAKLQISVPAAFGIGMAVIVLMWFVIRLIAELLVKYPMDTKALGAAGKTIVG